MRTWYTPVKKIKKDLFKSLSSFSSPLHMWFILVFKKGSAWEMMIGQKLDRKRMTCLFWQENQIFETVYVLLKGPCFSEINIPNLEVGSGPFLIDLFHVLSSRQHCHSIYWYRPHLKIKLAEGKFSNPWS